VSQPALDAEAAWTRLRRHLEMTVGQASLVFVVCQSADDENLLQRRTQQLVAQIGWTYELADPESFPAWAPDHVPFDGVLWLPLRLADDAWATRCLHVLNHIRANLARPKAGCVIVAATSKLIGMAMREAADLWSIRSFVQFVDAPNTKRPPAITVPPIWRSAQVVTLVADLNHVYQALPNDPAEASRRLCVAAENATNSGPTQEIVDALLALAGLYVAGATNDKHAVTYALAQATKCALALPPDASCQWLLDAIQVAAQQFGWQPDQSV